MYSTMVVSDDDPQIQRTRAASTSQKTIESNLVNYYQ